MSTKLKIETGSLVAKAYFDPRVNKFVISGDPTLDTEDIVSTVEDQIKFVKLEDIGNVVEPDDLNQGSTLVYDEATQKWIARTDIDSGYY